VKVGGRFWRAQLSRGFEMSAANGRAKKPLERQNKKKLKNLFFLYSFI
jgi:hypothetical protein